MFRSSCPPAHTVGMMGRFPLNYLYRDSKNFLRFGVLVTGKFQLNEWENILFRRVKRANRDSKRIHPVDYYSARKKDQTTDLHDAWGASGAPH